MTDRNRTEDGDIRYTRVTIKHNGHEYHISVSIFATDQDRHKIFSGVYEAMRRFHVDMQQTSDEAISQKQLLHTILDRYPQTRTDPEVMKWLIGEF